MTTTQLNPTLSRDAVDFIDDAKLEGLLARPRPDAQEVRDIVAKSLAKVALSVEETSRLILADDADLTEEIFQAARDLKKRVYGNRIVLFAPLYVGSYCINDCAYCGFRRSNPDSLRRTLTPEELVAQVSAIEQVGHKRLILVFGEHPKYDAEFMAETVRRVYDVRVGHGEIRRVNINAAPLDHDGFRTLVDANIGTYQIFQETYHHPTYATVHPAGTRKGDYLWRLDALSRAMESGQNDVGIGALFGLADWRFETLGLVEHALHLQGKYDCGPHTISFPRLTQATGMDLDSFHQVADHDFKRLVAILRLAVPYTGLILTARESAAVRRDVLAFGVSQIDAGTKIELGGYTETTEIQNVRREQFTIGDTRSLDQVVGELIHEGYVPSWCTSCYRLGRTGEHFMEFAIPGFIKQFCTPNALTTLQEYLVDYAAPATREAGQQLIADEMAKLEDGPIKSQLVERLEAIRSTEARDLYF
jgi:2-iminoacetate synthase